MFKRMCHSGVTFTPITTAYPYGLPYMYSRQRSILMIQITCASYCTVWSCAPHCVTGWPNPYCAEEGAGESYIRLQDTHSIARCQIWSSPRIHQRSAATARCQIWSSPIIKTSTRARRDRDCALSASASLPLRRDVHRASLTAESPVIAYDAACARAASSRHARISWSSSCSGSVNSANLRALARCEAAVGAATKAGSFPFTTGGMGCESRPSSSHSRTAEEEEGAMSNASSRARNRGRLSRRMME